MAKEKRPMLADTYYLGYGTAIIVALVAILVAALPSSFGLGAAEIGATMEVVARGAAAAILVLSVAYLSHLSLSRAPVPKDQLTKGPRAGDPQEKKGS